MTAYQMSVAGTEVVVLVGDSPEAVELAASLRIVAAPTPPEAGLADHLRLVGPLEEGTRYFWGGSSLGLYLFDGLSALRVTDRPGPVPTVLELGVDGVPCMSIADGSDDYVVDRLPNGNASRGVAVVADALDSVASAGWVTVVVPPTPLSLGGIEASAMDVTAVDVAETATGLSMQVQPGMTSRIVAVPRDGDGAPDIVTVQLGTPCEMVLESLEVVPVG